MLLLEMIVNGRESSMRKGLQIKNTLGFLLSPWLGYQIGNWARLDCGYF